MSFHVDLDGMITKLSDPFLYFFNIEKNKALGVHFSTFFQTNKQALHEDENSVFSAYNLRGDKVYFSATIIPIYKNKKIVENFIVCQDITYLKQAQRKIEYLYDVDALTGLPNRQYMLKTIDKFLKTSSQCDLVLLSIKRFREINLEYGCHAGDMLLKHITQLLFEIVGFENTIARVSGDEFSILFDTIDAHTLPSLSTIIRDIENSPLPYTKEDTIEFQIEGVEISCNNTQEDAMTLMKQLSKKMAKKKL
jgi:diguanylate cyclase (GGDEF)-like protein